MEQEETLIKTTVRNELACIVVCLRGIESVSLACESGEMMARGLTEAMLALMVLAC